MAARYDVEQGDAVHPGDPVMVDRYTPGARVNHWITGDLLGVARDIRAGVVLTRACFS